MSLIKRRQHTVPGLNTASLPDLVFSVLFFFMIVTHMQKVAVKVRYRAPQGTHLTRLTKKSTVTYIYIGAPASYLHSNLGTTPRVQINNKFVSVDEVADYIAAERERMQPEDQEHFTVSIKADRDVPMGLISDVKQALRKAKAYNISYSAVEEKQPSEAKKSTL